jgi:hypothetical protein
MGCKMISIAYQRGVHTALEKCGWFGTYYHGTSPQAESNILQEGLRADRGGKGGASAAFDSLTGLKGITEKQVAESANRVTMSRSKTLAKIYGAITNPSTADAATAMSHPKISPVRSLQDALTNARANNPHMRQLVRNFVEYQPLQIAGQTLPNLTRDPSHRLLAVQTTQNVAPSLIRKAQPSRIGRILTRLLK